MRRVLAATALTAAALSAGVIGPGTVAHAAGGVPGVDLVGTGIDPESVTAMADNALQKTTAELGRAAGGGELGRTLSAAGRTGGVLRQTTSGVQRFIGQTAGSAGQSIGGAMTAGARGSLPKGSLPEPGSVPGY
ncbi:ATP-binding protein [Streptomyces griseocarneus]|uniref:ATP-binding protein n=1 Tax=Streptomyces griseocarneus TaxID=51201 RepID=UPI00167E554F|nr:ATP-binding protein [Streptomyces griseocarneus]MBZ6474105.1 ATP-binding protein [Streptomyces griseocarneus]GHG52125.1 hypothetical protein GCM10018779_12930 [Streptomyces griseocarneus]